MMEDYQLVEKFSLDESENGRISDDVPLTNNSQKHQYSTLQIVKVCAFWFGYNFSGFLLNVAIIPAQIQIIMGDDKKGAGLSALSLTGGIITLLLATITGALNDNFTSRFGKRAPWILLGSIGTCFSFFTLSSQQTLGQYLIGNTLITIFSIISSVCFNGLITDMSSASNNQIGKISSIMGAANLLGYLFAAIIGTQISVFGVSGLFIIMAIILFGSAALTCYQPEPKVNYSINFQLKRINLYQFITNDMIEPLVKSVDFRYLFASRFFYQIGIATVQQFLQYWIADCASSVLSNIAGVSLAMIPLLVASPIAALLIPANKRKIVVYVSTLFMILACVLMIFVSKYWITFLISFIFGIGFGPFLSVEFAMLLDILPNPETAARDISIWHMALVLPQLTATPIAGIIRDYFQEVGKQLAQQCLGYQILFSITIFYLIVGAWFTRIIKNVK